MPFVTRDTANKIIAIYANKQDFTDEYLDTNSKEVLEFFTPQLTYKELRAAEFNLKSTGEQFGMMYDDAVNGTTTWVDWQTEIKARIAK